MKLIYLASNSPRRKEMLKQLIGENFQIIKSEYEEDNELDMSPTELVIHHSVEKGRDVIRNLKKGTVISADTVVVFNNMILGKPHTPEKAKEFLKELSGKSVEVITGYAVIDAETKQEIQGYEITKIQIGELSESLIDAYVKTGEPLDKAGAFGIQGRGAIIIKKIDGCYFNVMGLPLYSLNKVFEKIGFSIFDFKMKRK